MKLRWWRTADEMASDFAKRFPAKSDDEFLAELGVPRDPQFDRAALAVRYSVAKYGAVETAHIYPDHAYPGELESLSGWDSLDFIGWALELELELGTKVQSDWFKPMPSRFSVRDLVVMVQNGYCA